MDDNQRPQRVVHEKIPVGPRRMVKDIKELIPPKYLTCIKDNEALAECCRDVETSFLSTFKSNRDLPDNTQDLLEIQCDCGKTQYRSFVNLGRLGGVVGE